MTIALSAGHNPVKKGACYLNFCEYDEAVLWVELIAEHLGNHAYIVPTGKLKDKVKAINERDCVLAVEIHFNSAVNSVGKHVGKGSETLYCPGSERGEYAANAVQEVLAPTLFRDRGIKEGWYQMNKNKGPDYFLAKTNCPAIILEPDFIHRVRHITNNRELACKAIASALMNL